MKEVARKARTRWQRLSRWTQITVLTLIVLIVAARLALPYVVKSYVNRQLSQLPEYNGRVDRVSIHLIRGAYTIHGLEIVKTNASIPVPFLSAPRMDLSVEWRELFHGALVGEVEIDRPQLNFVNGPTEDQQQTGVDKGWTQTLESLFPFTINRFQVDQGDIRFRDFHREPKVNIYITNLYATATNLSNSRDLSDKLPAGLVARGGTIGEGGLHLELHMNPLADEPTFKLEAGITNMDLVAINDFMRAYGKFDIESGRFHVFTEMAAADGRFEGYVKPLFEDLDVFDWDTERKKNILKIFWEAIVSGVAMVFKNQPQDRFATKIPISGNFEKTDIDLWATIGGVLRNAFVRAVVPKIDRSVKMEDVEKDKKESRND